MNIRNYADKDFEVLFRLYNEIMADDRVSLPFFIQHLLMAPNFDPQGTFLAEKNGDVIGWTSAQMLRKDYDVWGNQAKKNEGTGFIMPPVARDIETGKLLIAAAEKYCKQYGCRSARGGAAGYTLFPNGVDPVAYPVIHESFVQSGYSAAGHSNSMRRTLDGYTVPEKIRLKTEALAAEGITAGICQYTDLPGLRHLLAETTLNGWMHLPLRKAEQGKLHEAVIVRHGDEIVGYCQYNYFGETERIGPFGVSPSMRGRGVGLVMIAKLLQVMAERGFKYAWFASCTDSLVPFYEQNGLRVFRTKTIFRKELENL